MSSSFIAEFECISNADAEFLDETRVDLKGIGCPFRRLQGFADRAGLEILPYSYDRPVSVKEEYIYRKFHSLHPEKCVLTGVKKEEHAVFRGQHFPARKTLHLRHAVIGNLDPEDSGNLVHRHAIVTIGFLQYDGRLPVKPIGGSGMREVEWYMALTQDEKQDEGHVFKTMRQDRSENAARRQFHEALFSVSCLLSRGFAVFIFFRHFFSCPGCL